MTIHAFTELHSNFPAYINLSEQPGGAIKFSVRTRGNDGKEYAAITLTALEAEELADSIYKHNYKGEGEIDKPTTHPAPTAEKASADGKALLDDALSTVLWLERRLPKVYGGLTPFVTRTIQALAKRTGVDVSEFLAGAAPDEHHKDYCQGCCTIHKGVDCPPKVDHARRADDLVRAALIDEVDRSAQQQAAQHHPKSESNQELASGTGSVEHHQVAGVKDNRAQCRDAAISHGIAGCAHPDDLYRFWMAAQRAQQAGDALDASRFQWLLSYYARGDGYNDIDAALNDGDPEKMTDAIDAAMAASAKQGGVNMGKGSQRRPGTIEPGQWEAIFKRKLCGLCQKSVDCCGCVPTDDGPSDRPPYERRKHDREGV